MKRQRVSLFLVVGVAAAHGRLPFADPGRLQLHDFTRAFSRRPAGVRGDSWDRAAAALASWSGQSTECWGMPRRVRLSNIHSRERPERLRYDDRGSSVEARQGQGRRPFSPASDGCPDPLCGKLRAGLALHAGLRWHHRVVLLSGSVRRTKKVAIVGDGWRESQCGLRSVAVPTAPVTPVSGHDLATAVLQRPAAMIGALCLPQRRGRRTDRLAFITIERPRRRMLW